MTFIHCGDEKSQEIKLGEKVGVTQCGSLRPSCGLSRVKIALFPGSCLRTQGPILDHGDDALASRGFPGVANADPSQHCKRKTRGPRPHMASFCFPSLCHETYRPSDAFKRSLLRNPASFIPVIYSCRLPCLHGNPPPVGTISPS